MWWGIIVGAAAIVAAIAASWGLWLRNRRRRPDLSIQFTRSASASDKSVTFILKVRNNGDHTAHDVTAVPLLGGKPAGEPQPQSQSIAPTKAGVFNFILARPDEADFEPGPRLTFHGKTFSARVTIGERSATVDYGQGARLK